MRAIAVVLLACAGLVTLSPFAASGEADRNDSTFAEYRRIARRMLETGLREGGAYTMLEELLAKAPRRLSGSRGAAVAVQVTQELMRRCGAESVREEPVMVPRWVRGDREEAVVLGKDGTPLYSLAACALGGSIATPAAGISAEVIEVRSFDELRTLGQKARGKIVFFNRPMDPSHFVTGNGYGGAVDQRSSGAIEAARAGGVAAVVRSVTLARDRMPHTGSMSYVDTIPKVPGLAISTVDADSLSVLLRQGPVRLRVRLNCKTLPDAPSANVLGEIRGTEHPEEVIVVGGHLDCWLEAGAHDDGGGCIQAIEVLNLFRKLGLAPKRTVRAVMFMNEENGLRGGRAYAKAAGRRGERHIAAIESDRGVFAPRGFTVQSDSTVLARVQRWSSLFEEFLADRFTAGYGGVDISPLVATGVPGFGLEVDNHRYFDYHHSMNDTIDKVHPREIELGAIAEALLCYLIAQEGM